MALYAKGVTTRDIQDHLQRLYGIEASPALISNVTNKVMPLIKEWQNRPLHSIYAVVFMDAIHFNVKQDGMITKKAAYMAVGIDLDGKKDVLGIWIGEHESAKFWLSVLNELKNRGVQDILIISVDNLTGFSEAIGKGIFPTDEALLKMLFLATQDVMRKWTGRIQNWGQILLQLSIFFPDKVKPHLR